MLSDADIFDASTSPPAAHRGLYVALSGNTSAGKSSLIETLAARARESGMPAVGISERAFHDRFLRLMFSQPQSFAFPVQISFMLQRHMVLLRNLQLGRMVIIERSHFDDEMFMREHFDRGRISAAERAAYEALAASLHEKLPAPDVLVLMNPDPELSLQRLGKAEASGQRPREFPDEPSKEEWVRRWHRYYVELHDDYRDRFGGETGVELVEAAPEQGTEALAELVFAAIRVAECQAQPQS